jgi:hypothetical protein
MLPSSKPLEYVWPLKIPELAPKDTAEDRYVKPPPIPGRLAGLRPWRRFPVALPLLSLAIRAKILINRAIRGSRPGAERTVSAISPHRRH